LQPSLAAPQQCAGITVSLGAKTIQILVSGHNGFAIRTHPTTAPQLTHSDKGSRGRKLQISTRLFLQGRREGWRRIHWKRSEEGVFCRCDLCLCWRRLL